MFPGQSVLLRGKEGSAAEGSLGRHPSGTLERRPDEELSPGWWQKHSGSGRGIPCDHNHQHTWEQHEISRCVLLVNQVYSPCHGDEELSQTQTTSRRQWL